MMRSMALAMLLAGNTAFAEPARLSYEVVRALPHDASSFTQGLLQQGDTLVETSGLTGRSFVYRYQIETGKVLARQALPSSVFAEGIAAVGDRLYVLTWQDGLLMTLDRETLQVVETRTYEGEGWGLTFDGTHFLMSNGSDEVAVRDPQTFDVKRVVTVTGGGERWTNLNELEHAEGLLWANIWQKPIVVAIDPLSGQVRAIVDFSPLVQINSRYAGHTVLNGIAYNPERKTFWITGKYWPNLYEVKINLSTLKN